MTSSAVAEYERFLTLMATFSLRRVMPGYSRSVSPLDERRAAGELGVHPLGGPVVERQDVVARRLDQEQLLQLGELLRVRAARSFDWVQSVVVS